MIIFLTVLVQLHFVFSGALYAGKRDVSYTVFERNICVPGTSWKLDCNSCTCTENGVPDCTLLACIKWERVTKKPGLIQQLKGLIDANGKCKPFEVLEIDCNKCFCSEDGELYCTRRQCKKRERRASSGVPDGGKCKPGDRWKLDECNNCVCTHTGFASCTLNDCSASKPNQKRPKREPAESGKIPDSGKCKPGDRWKLDECNNCVCTHTGYASCTLNDCSASKPNQKRPKREPAESGKIPDGGKCKPGDRWKLDECNNCVCTHTGFASCTLNDCSATKPNQKRPKREPAESGKIPDGGKCKPGDKWKLDECNNCVCTHTGFASCTLNDCSAAKPNQKRPKREPAESGKIPDGGKCKPGDRWKLDECNNCVCTHTGFASCTLNDCSASKPNQKRPKREPAEPGKIPDGGKCKPGDRWKLDECNNCVCTHTGFASCTLNDCSSSKPNQKRPKRELAESGKIPEGGKCKPGDKWKLDECNSCHCTHTGYASCTLNDCSSNKGRGKRSPDGSQLSDFVDENWRCKENATFKLDCNTCFCQKGKYAGCTLIGCPEYLNKTQRIKREVFNDQADFVTADGKCKAKGSFKMDCNTCFCMQEGAYAHCTLIHCPKENNQNIRIAREARNENDFFGRHVFPKPEIFNEFDVLGGEVPSRKLLWLRFKGNSGLDCKPGISWKENCNSCFCSERGIAMCTDIPTCPTPPPPPAKRTQDTETKGSVPVSTTLSSSPVSDTTKAPTAPDPTTAESVEPTSLIPISLSPSHVVELKATIDSG